MTVSVASKITLGFAVALAVLLVVGAVSYQSSLRLVEYADLVAHTREVMARLESVLVSASNVVIGARGYVITGEERYLEPYRSGAVDLERDLAALKTLVADNRAQEARLDVIALRVAAAGQWFAETIRLRQAAGAGLAMERVGTGGGQRHIDEIRALIRTMVGEEEVLLVRRTAQAKAVERVAIGVILGGTALALIFLTAAGAVIHREIRSRREIEGRIRESEARYRNLFDRVPVGLYRSTPDGRILDANPAMVQMLGYPDVASLKAAGALAVYADPSERRDRVLERLDREGTVRDLEIRWRRSDGTEIWARNNVRAATGADGQVLYEGAVEDITEARRTQEALANRTRALETAQEELVRKERLAVLGQLAGGVSHELRNPLGVIKNSAYYLKMLLPDDERMRKHLGIVEREVATATRIVTDLLDFARVTPPTRVATDLSALARETLERVPPPDGVRVALALADDLPSPMLDPEQVGLVLGNLIRNAAQAMPEGGVLSVETAAAAGGVTVAVADTGVGIAPEHLEKIFEPLFTTKARGIGLGLAVARGLVEANGGRIDVRSAPGRGSRFAVHFSCPAEGA
jgi:PAS domain S-box-containing protein